MVPNPLSLRLIYSNEINFPKNNNKNTQKSQNETAYFFDQTSIKISTLRVNFLAKLSQPLIFCIKHLFFLIFRTYLDNDFNINTTYKDLTISSLSTKSRPCSISGIKKYPLVGIASLFCVR